MPIELDEAVLDYLLDEYTSSRPVSNKDLQAKALELAPGLHGSSINLQSLTYVAGILDESIGTCIYGGHERHCPGSTHDLPALLACS